MSKISVVLIDADVVRYEYGSLKEQHPFLPDVSMPMGIGLLERRIAGFFEKALEATGADRYETYLSGKGNWRHEISKQVVYKGTRILPKPANWHVVSDILSRDYSPILSVGCEADDLLAIRQRELTAQGVVSCIASIDKDMKTVEGWHWNWRKDSEGNRRPPFYMSDFESKKFFYWQMLAGDSADNILGCAYMKKTLGKKGAKAGLGYMKKQSLRRPDLLLEECTTEEELYNAVREQYIKTFGYQADELMLENARLLYVGQRGLDDLYEFPRFE